MSKFRVCLMQMCQKLGVKTPRSVAGKFYLKTLPKMVTIPEKTDTIPTVNVWLWLIGYLRFEWPKTERALINLKKILRDPNSARVALLGHPLDERFAKRLSDIKSLAPVKAPEEEISVNPRMKK